MIYQEMTEEIERMTINDPKTRCAAANAHGFKTKSKAGLCFCVYPVNYKITREQRERARTALKKAEKAILRNHLNDLLFVGMGCVNNLDNSDVGNYRIRTEFLNAAGHKFFVELSYYSAGIKGNGNMMVDYAINLEDHSTINGKDGAYNYHGLERKTGKLGSFTKDNILKLINKEFYCNFHRVVIDNYTVRPVGVLCISPELTKSVKVIFEEDKYNFYSTINGSANKIKRYYIGRYINIEPYNEEGKETFKRVIDVKFIDKEEK